VTITVRALAPCGRSLAEKVNGGGGGGAARRSARAESSTQAEQRTVFPGRCEGAAAHPFCALFSLSLSFSFFGQPHGVLVNCAAR